MGFVRDHINQITKTKDPDYFKNLSEEGKKSFNVWFILKYLSYSYDLIPIISSFPPSVYSFPPHVLYEYLIEKIPSGDYSFKVIKRKKGRRKVDKEVVELLSRFYQCSRKQSEEYFQILDETGQLEKTREELVTHFGGTIS